MSGFDISWLTLREPADFAARDPRLVSGLAAHLRQKNEPISALDLGCGTGSTFRAISEALPQVTDWLLVDNDPALLEEARRHAPPNARVRAQLQDLASLEEIDFSSTGLVTASAFFDLVSQSFCQRLVGQMAGASCAFYTALTYNGEVRWSVSHELDDAVLRDFNAHQRTDKGLGQALGPDATPSLTALLQKAGYTVSTGDSPWLLGAEEARLQAIFLDGFRKPVLEIGNLSIREVSEWLAFRLGCLEKANSRCEVGHTDLLALPPA